MQHNGVRERLLKGLAASGREPQTYVQKRRMAALAQLERVRQRQEMIRQLQDERRPLRSLRLLSEHVERLRSPDWCFGEAHSEKLWSVTEIGEPREPVRLFARRFVRAAGQELIPLYVRKMTTFTVEVFHAEYENLLGERDWWIIGNIGREAARSLGVTVQWGGHPSGSQAVGDHPHLWEVDCQDGSSD